MCIRFSGFKCVDYMLKLPPEELLPTFLKVSVGATIAFAMEISEFLVVTYTSSLTLSIAGIFKVRTNVNFCYYVKYVKLAKS